MSLRVFAAAFCGTLLGTLSALLIAGAIFYTSIVPTLNNRADHAQRSIDQAAQSAKQSAKKIDQTSKLIEQMSRSQLRVEQRIEQRLSPTPGP